MIIYLTNLKILTTIGHYDWEKEEERPLWLNIELEISPPSNDQLEETIDYEKVQNDLIEYFKNKQFNLIETIAQKTIDLISQYQILKMIKVEVKKPQALEHCDEVSVSLTKSF